MNFLSILSVPLGWIMWAIYYVIPNYGLALIVFTIITRAAQFPLGIKQHKSSIQMSAFKPKLDELKKKYGNNKDKYNEELQRMTTEEGYKPLGGCLPQAITLLIVFGLIDVVYKPLTYIMRFNSDIISQATEIAKGILGDGFKGNTAQLQIIKAFGDAPESFSALGSEFTEKVSSFDLKFLGIDLGVVPTFAFNPYILVPILAGALLFASSAISMRLNPAMQMNDQGMGGTTKTMMYFMPLMSAFFSFMVPVGVSMYWILGNLLQLGQSFILNRMYNPKELAEKARLEMEARKKEKKKKVVVTTATEENEDGEVVEVTETLSGKEAQKRKIAEARRRMAEKYGEEVKDDE